MSTLRYAVRQLLKRPGFSGVIVLMLALGIGATTAMFSMFHTMLLKPLPVPEAGRLVNLGAPGPKWGPTSCGAAGPCDYVFSYPMFRDLETEQDVFTGLAGHRVFDANLSTGVETTSGSGIFVSGRYFDTLNLQPALGRLIGPQDDARIGESTVAVLSFAYWQREFGADPGVLGRTVTVNGHPLTIIGVTPERFGGTTIGLHAQVFVPLTLRWLVEPGSMNDDSDRKSYWLYVFGRLRDGVSLEQASAGLNVLYSGILNDVEAPLNADMPPQTLQQFRERKIPLERGASGQSSVHVNGRLPLALLLGVTSLVLLIACVNIASLLLARGASRSGEIAIRASLGATRPRLVFQFLAETALLGLLGGLASLPVAELTLRSVVAMIPQHFRAGSISFSIDSTAMLFAAGTTFATLMLFGLVPAFHGASTNPGTVAKGHAPGSVGGRGVLRFRRVLATTQIAFSMLLLVFAGFFVQSMVNVSRVDLGLRVESLVAFTVSPGLNGYDPSRLTGLFERLEEEFAAEPGVSAVGTAMVPLLSGSNWNRPLSVDGFESGPGIDSVAWFNRVNPGFFDVFSVPLLSGRDFTQRDAGDTPRVGIVNEAFLRKFNLGADAVGKRFAVGAGASELDIEIVGVVADAKYSEVRDEIPPQYFLPRLQLPELGTLTFYLRTAVSPDAIMERVGPIVASVDPNLPVIELMTMDRVVQANVFLDRMLTAVSASFAGLATLLAAVGLYSVLAFSVTQRTREFGLRLALGATPRGLRSLVLKQVGRMAAIGVPVGLVGAILLGRGAESLLYGLSGYEPTVLAAAVVLICAVVLLAGLIPARRASNIAPMEALRYE
jgi:predicted permease